jgi:hypothetical protein
MTNANRALSKKLNPSKRSKKEGLSSLEIFKKCMHKPRRKKLFIR